MKASFFLLLFLMAINLIGSNNTPEWFPPHLAGANHYLAPKTIKKFANKYGVKNVVFIDDSIKCKRSVRLNENIFINVRATYWDAMILPPWNCISPEEAILQRILHEIGHVYFNHSGDKNLESKTTGLEFKRGDIWDVLRGNEKEVWDFCFDIRKTKNKQYNRLLQTISKWYNKHNYTAKDWTETPAKQWKEKSGNELPDDLWQFLPKWIVDEYKK